jgi:hypothetical protein
VRRTVRLHASVGPEERLATAIGDLPAAAQRALVQIADREDLPLVAGSWEAGGGGCLVANVVRALDVTPPGATGRSSAGDAGATFDVRVLDLLPELSSRDLNHLIVAWDEAAAQEGRSGDPALRRLLRGALVRAGVPPTLEALDARDLARDAVRDPAPDRTRVRSDV